MTPGKWGHGGGGGRAFGRGWKGREKRREGMGEKGQGRDRRDTNTVIC